MTGNRITIFITCFFGSLSRDILGTDVLRLLRSRANTHTVILVPQSRKSGLEKEFSGVNVEVVGVDNVAPKRSEIFMRGLFLNLLDTETRRIQRLVRWKRDRGFFWYLATSPLPYLGRVKFVRWISRLADGALMKSAGYEGYFQSYRPDLLFSTDITTPNDVLFMRTAKRLGVPFVGMVRSWDNLTMYGILRVTPPKILVQNETARDELIRYHDVNSDTVSVVGVPHYDLYRREPRTPRDIFLKKLGLDPQKKTVFYAVPGRRHLVDQETNRHLIMKLAELPDVNVLVRTPLIGNADLGQNRYPPNVVIDWLKSSNDVADIDLTLDADRHLADSIASCDLVLTGPSTIAVDGLVFEKPVVLVAFEYAPLPYWQSIRRLFDYDHVRFLTSNGGVGVAKNEKELLTLVAQHLRRPETGRDKRIEILQKKCGEFDGQAAQRIVSYLLSVFT